MIRSDERILHMGKLAAQRILFEESRHEAFLGHSSYPPTCLMVPLRCADSLRLLTPPEG
jgi:hypothetical protein